MNVKLWAKSVTHLCGKSYVIIPAVSNAQNNFVKNKFNLLSFIKEDVYCELHADLNFKTNKTHIAIAIPNPLNFLSSS